MKKKNALQAFQSKGGKARAKKLSKAELTRIAMLGVEARAAKQLNLEKGIAIIRPKNYFINTTPENEYEFKQKARRVTSNAIRNGELERKPCQVCGSLKSHSHHTDYSKPLKVVWLCAQHHKDVHMGKINLLAS